jgi:hypothetical protein
MADSLASLFPTLYAGIAEFPRRQFGMIRAVQVDGQLSRAAKGQSVVWDVPQVSGLVDIEPAATLPAPSADVAKALTYTMAYRKGVRIAVTGEASEAIGDAAMAIRRQNQYLQAFDKLAAGIESYLAGVAILNASRAFGTADTVPFTSSYQPGVLRKTVGYPGEERPVQWRALPGAEHSNCRGDAGLHGHVVESQ